MKKTKNKLYYNGFLIILAALIVLLEIIVIPVLGHVQNKIIKAK